MEKVAGLLFKISADTQALRQGMTRAQQQTQKMKSSMKALGGVMLATFSVTMIKSFITESVKLYDIQAKAEAKLLTAFKGRTDIQQRLITQAGELQKLTLFGDEATIEAQALLGSLGLTEKQILKLMPAIQDMATGLKMDLVSAASLVGKSVTTTTDALARYFDTGLKGVSEQSERAAVLTESLSKKFDGQSEAARMAGTGGLTAMKNVLSDIREELGKAIVGSEDFSKGMSDMANELGAIDWEKAFKGLKDGGEILAKLNPLYWMGKGSAVAIGAALPKKQASVEPITNKPSLGKNTLPQVPARPALGFGNIAGLSDTVTGRVPGSDTSIPSPIAGMGEAFQIDVSKMAEAAGQLKEQVVPKIKESMVDLSVVMQQTFMSAVDAFGQGIENLFAGTANLENGFKKILGGIGRFMVQMGTMMIAYGIAQEAFAAAVKTIFSGVSAVAVVVAGTALVGIGSAISGLASRASASGGGYSGGVSPGSASYSSGSQTQLVQFEGVLKGHDIYLSQKNYVSHIGRM